MQTRYKNELISRLEDVSDLGCAVIRKAELLKWHEKEKLMKSVWRSVYDHWIEIDDEEPLLIGDGEGTVTLIYGEGLAPKSGEWKDGWFQDIRTWAGVEIEDEV